MSSVSWLHISDFHFKPEDKFNSKIVQDALLENLRTQSKEGFHPDFVIFSGDLAYSGKPQQYKMAAEFFDDVMRIFGLEKKRTPARCAW